MLTYVLIGLGGAAGSVLRAWLGTAMLAVTGAAFPWGTILINVLGSFVIGFFGTLTALDSRWSTAPDLRAFVMVGLCGGFTTFSSFSLQTLDLIRDGRPGQALANVALSVLLCLGSVAAGSSTALLLRTSGLGARAQAGPDTLGHRTVIALYRPQSVRPMLEIAARLMEHRPERMTALAIDGPAMGELQPTEEILTAERRRELSEARRDWVGAMRPALDRWVQDERRTGHRARWIEVQGDGARAIVEHGRGAHLLLLEHQPGDPAHGARIRSALAGTSRPLLLVPPSATGEIGRVVAVAWRDTPEARRAVARAMPILRRAERIVVLRVGSPENADPVPPDPFGGLPVDTCVVAAAAAPIGERLLDLARAHRADLLLLDGGDRGRISGGPLDEVTEAILRHADLPVLIQRDAA